MNMIRKLSFFTVALVALFGLVSTAHSEIKQHAAGVVVLVEGAERGTITTDLIAGTITETGNTVLFTITDASDADFVDLFGGVHAPALDDAPAAAVELDATFDGINWTFAHDPGVVAHDDGAGGVNPPLGNLNYSPLKRLMWNGKLITINAPFVVWGTGPGQRLLVDTGGCDPLIRSNPPSPFFVGNGPTNGADCSVETDPLVRYKGGQALDIDEVGMTVTMKLHKGTFRENKLPYYTVFDASKQPPAGFMGVIHTPKVGANLGRFGDNKAVGSIEQFSNGVRINAAGPNRFQGGITSYPGGPSRTYSPMWHITWLFWDCNNNGIFFAAGRNVGEGDVPVAGSGIPQFDPADPATFDPFGMDDKGVDCPAFAAARSGNADGIIFYGDVDDMIGDGVMVRTEGPAGLRLNSPLQPPLIVNCPVPVTVRF